MPLFAEELASGTLRQVKSRRLVWQSAVLLRPETNSAPLVKLLLDELQDLADRYR